MHTFVDPLYRAQKLFANHVAIVSGDVRLTYAETWSRCRRLAGALTQLRIQQGDRVAILALNCHQYLEVYMAVPASGRVVVPRNTRQARRGPAESAPCRARTVLCSGGLGHARAHYRPRPGCPG